jgi:hypothetical protein
MRLGAALLSLLVLSGCAGGSAPLRTITISGKPVSAESLAASQSAPYWHFDAPYIDVTEITQESREQILDRCVPGSRLDVTKQIAYVFGCFDRADGSIHVRNDLSPAQLKCVVRHELKHAEGYNHFTPAPANTILCGDGTKWVRGPGEILVP